MTAKDGAQLWHSKVFMDAADPILIEDRNGVVVDLNEEAERTYGFSREELIGQPIKTLVPPDRHGQADEALARCLAGESVRNAASNKRRFVHDTECRAADDVCSEAASPIDDCERPAVASPGSELRSVRISRTP